MPDIPIEAELRLIIPSGGIDMAVISLLNMLLRKDQQIMDKLDEISAAMAGAAAAMSAEREQVRAALDGLNLMNEGLKAQIVDLQTQLASGVAVDPARLQGLLDQANSLTAGIADIYVPVEPVTEPFPAPVPAEPIGEPVLIEMPPVVEAPAEPVPMDPTDPSLPLA